MPVEGVCIASWNVDLLLRVERPAVRGGLPSLSEQRAWMERQT